MNMIYFLIEFLDELVFGISEAALPFIRDDLHLNYAQIGLALSLPGFIANFIEPFLYAISDVWKRRAVILVGGIFFTISLFLTGISTSFALLLASFILFNPSSGAFVSLSQASLMDADPIRRENNMARWTFAGSLGVLIGPILLAAAAWIGFGWRGMFIGVALLSTLILIFAWRRIPHDNPHPVSFPRFGDIFKQFGATFTALKNWTVVRWLILLEFSDLMLDIFYGFLPLYFVDIAGFTPAQAALSVSIWAGVGLLGDFLLIPLVERVKGLDYLRLSVIVELILFPSISPSSNFLAQARHCGTHGILQRGLVCDPQSQAIRIHARAKRRGVDSRQCLWPDRQVDPIWDRTLLHKPMVLAPPCGCCSPARSLYCLACRVG